MLRNFQGKHICIGLCASVWMGRNNFKKFMQFFMTSFISGSTSFDPKLDAFVPAHDF